MTKSKRLGASVAVGALVLSAGAAWASVKKGEVVTVRAISARVQKAAKFLSKTVAEVSRGEELTLREDESGDWLHVTTHSGDEGYINRGVVFEEKVQLSSRPGGGSDDSSSSREMELAGRGFTPDVEKQYRGDHADMEKAFKDVDLIEKLKPDQNAVVDFAQQGGVGGGS